MKVLDIFGMDKPNEGFVGVFLLLERLHLLLDRLHGQTQPPLLVRLQHIHAHRLPFLQVVGDGVYPLVRDLGNVQQISKIGAGFLQDVGSWIYMPARVEIEVSIDGRSFSPAISIANEVSDKQEGVVIRDFVKSVSKQARYIKIRAVNLREQAWIFVDEILIQ